MNALFDRLSKTVAPKHRKIDTGTFLARLFDDAFKYSYEAGRIKTEKLCDLIRSNSINEIVIYLKDNNLNIPALDSYIRSGLTPLITAILYDSKDVVRLLLDHGASLFFKSFKIDS